MCFPAGDMDDSSPYEPVPQHAPNRHHDAFRLASISSGITGLKFTQVLVFFNMNDNYVDICCGKLTTVLGLIAPTDQTLSVFTFCQLLTLVSF